MATIATITEQSSGELLRLANVDVETPSQVPYVM
jgi:hypothetical protein